MSLEPLKDAPKAARGSVLSFTGDAITAMGTWPLTKAAPAVAIALLRPMPTSFSVRGQCAKAKARADLRIADATGDGPSQPIIMKQRQRRCGDLSMPVELGRLQQRRATATDYVYRLRQLKSCSVSRERQGSRQQAAAAAAAALHVATSS